MQRVGSWLIVSDDYNAGASALGPGLPTGPTQQVVSCLGYTGHSANAFGRADRDPLLTFVGHTLAFHAGSSQGGRLAG
jgi:hypothetical protein